jgi:hypothetical protein
MTGPKIPVRAPYTLHGFALCPVLLSRLRDRFERGGPESFRSAGSRRAVGLRPGGFDCDCTRLGSNELARYAGKLPVSLLRNDVRESVDAISRDDHAGVRMSVQRLVDLGHRRVIHVDGGTAVSVALRRDAFQVEMRSHGLEPARQDQVGARGGLRE